MADLRRLTPAQRARIIEKQEILLRESNLEEAKRAREVVLEQASIELGIANQEVKDAEEALAKAKARQFGAEARASFLVFGE